MDWCVEREGVYRREEKVGKGTKKKRPALETRGRGTLRVGSSLRSYTLRLLRTTLRTAPSQLRVNRSGCAT